MKLRVTPEELRAYNLRAIHRYASGWLASGKIDGERSTPYFADRHYGGRHGALKAAIRWRNYYNPDRKPSYISRVDQEAKRNFGWNVRVIVGGEMQSRFFSDKKHGGKAKALKLAKAWRDQLVEAKVAKERGGAR